MLKVRLVALLATAGLSLLGCNGQVLDPATPFSSPALIRTRPVAPGPVASPPETGSAPAGPTFTREWAVSATGNDSADGSPEHPFRTFARAIHAAGPGERITVRAGTYTERLYIDASARSGRVDAKIYVQGEGYPRLTYRGAEYSVVQVEQANWVIDGFVVDVQRQPKVAVAFAGNTDGSVLSHTEAFGGTAGAGITTYGGARGVTIEANEIHDFTEGAADSHGVAVQPSSQNVTIRNNRIHDVSGDSVQCIGPEGYSNDPPADGVLIEGNELFHNRENAIDIKTCFNVTVRRNRMHDFRQALPGGCIVVVHMSARNVRIEDNDIFDGGKGIALGGNRAGPPPSGISIVKNRIYDIVAGAGELEGLGIRVENSTGAAIMNNTFTRIASAALMVGGGTGGATSALTVKNNIVSASPSVALGPQASGLVMGHNLYPDGAVFQSPSGSLDLAGWRGLGFDVSSEQGPPSSLLGQNWTPGQQAVDRGENVGLPYCGSAPDIGAVESGCG